MVFLVPADFLENYKCDECFKCLSVMPIKIYPKRQIKCGRCTKNDDGGINSLLQNFAELTLFKCINRFDGCKTILTSNEVEDHEKECLSKEQFCPICVDTTILPTYQILQHFKQYHRQSILDYNYYLLDIEEALEFKKVLLYRIKDYLFFIHIKSIPDSISFQTVRLGEHLTTDIVLKFFICSENSDVKNSIHGGSENGRVFIFPKSTFENNPLLVFFELKDEEITGKIVKVNERNKNNIENMDMLQNKIFLDEDLQKLQLKENVKMRNILPFCYVCSELFIYSEQFYTNHVQWCIEDGKYQYVCFACVSYFQTELKKTLVKNTSISFNMYKNIKYYCIWNCNLILTNEELLFHEISCSKQHLQECPIDCCEFKGTINVIEDHFDIAHDILLTFGSLVEIVKNRKNEIYLYIKGYFLKLSYIPNLNGDWIMDNFNVDFCKSKPTHLEILFFFFFGNQLIQNINLHRDELLDCKIVLKKK